MSGTTLSLAGFLRRVGRTLCIAALLAGLLPGVHADEPGDHAPWHVGLSSRVVHPAVERNWRGAATARLLTQIWYPVAPGTPETPREIGRPGDPIFRGQPVASDAALAGDAHTRFALVLLSHGTGGSANDQDWLASALAAHGYIVAAVNHPGNNELEPLTREGFLLWWERASDLSNVLDALLADPQFGPHIDQTRIGAAGFSLGGYTVLELAGARTDVDALEAFCRSPQADAICHPPEAKRLAGTASDGSGASGASGASVPHPPPTPEMRASFARSGDSYRDARVRAVFAIAPALGEAFDADAFKAVSIPVALLAGTADITVPPDTNVRRIAGFLPQASLTMVPGASHYTFLDVCLPGAAVRLARICKDGPGVDRDAVHALTANEALAFFDRYLAK
ncbi:putative dienelactone hydrolase [Paraburkholderia bannensis]|uniref:Putative dienelactone hydrolase n=1 Tax=Paraburkholderia bannensis TaxID=765414 RepID=A0A7W9U2K3_9BURK|nr:MULTISPECIES: alpha/beta hydrolase [Paraburkholderia]MBB3260704.1 putative dienelactone hydrolase [Paraburkholderia sp. WP4_3_2]MBB6105874.1 putative dienelactone hydrolase [Paraburkholderia bannensis]